MLRRGVVAAGAGCVTGVLLGLVVAQAQRTSAVPPSNTANISVAMTGDSIITRPFSSDDDPAFQRLIGLIRGQDAAFTNLEISLNDYESYPRFCQLGQQNERLGP